MARDELLRAALASPGDAERLVYADWLEEHGEIARAQLIHLQCELAQVAPRDRRRLELDWELDALLAEHGDRWRAELPAIPGVTWTTFARGFVAGIHVTDAGTLYRHADAIARTAPIEVVELATLDVPSYAAEVPALPWLRVLRVDARWPIANVQALRVDELIRLGRVDDARAHPLLSVPAEIEVHGADNGAELAWLARGPGLARLALIGGAAGNALATRLAAAPWAAGLETLELASHYVDDNSGYADDPSLGADGAVALTGLTRLVRLVVDRQRIGSTGVVQLLKKLPALRAFSARECRCTKLEAIAKAPGAALVELDLSRNAIGNAGVRILAGAPRMAALESLALDTCELASVGVAELARAPAWHTLRQLDLSRNPLGASGVRALAEAPRPPHLHTLRLADADLDEQAGHALAKIAWLGELAVLDLAGNPLGRGAAALRTIGPDALRHLSLASIGMERTEAAAVARFWPRLVHLDLGGNAITDAGLERFVMKEAPALQSLRLRDCALGDDGVELLADRARCPRLRTLDLAGTTICAALLARLLRAPIAHHLESLDLSHCGLSPAAGIALAHAPMPPRLRRLALRGNLFDEPTLLALAGSPALRSVPTILLDGDPWSFAPASRELLATRFGVGWYLEVP